MKVILSCSVCLYSALLWADSDPTKPDLVVQQVDAAPKAETVIAQHNLKLGLIRTVNNQPMAIINGKALRVGDEIEGFSVLAIQTQQVQLQKGELNIRLPLFKTMKTND